MENLFETLHTNYNSFSLHLERKNQISIFKKFQPFTISSSSFKGTLIIGIKTEIQQRQLTLDWKQKDDSRGSLIMNDNDNEHFMITMTLLKVWGRTFWSWGRATLSLVLLSLATDSKETVGHEISGETDHQVRHGLNIRTVLVTSSQSG